MDNKQIEKLLLTASVLLLSAGIIFLFISFFGDMESTAPLKWALGCIVLANLFSAIRAFRELKNKNK